VWVFIDSVVLTVVGAGVTAGWHILSKDGPAEAGDLAVGFDVLVGAVIMQVAFIPGSHGQVVAVRGAGVGILFFGLMIMAVVMRFCGYEPARTFRSGREKLIVYPMKHRAAVVTTSIGCVVLGAFWWLNVNIGLVLSAWKGVLH
jgi:hypothetical protein